MENNQNTDDRPTRPLRIPPGGPGQPAQASSEATAGPPAAGGQEAVAPSGAEYEKAPPSPTPSWQEPGESPTTVHYRPRETTPPYSGSLPRAVVTSPPMPGVNTAETGVRRAPCALWGLVILSLVISLASLGLNGFLIYRFVAVRDKVVGGLDAAIVALDNIGGKGFQYEYRLKRTVPFSGDIPIKQEMDFPFEGDFPINTTVQVPVDAGLLGTFQVKVPINTTVHINTSVPVNIDETFHVETEVPVDLKIPINIQAGDPAIQGLLAPIRTWLVELRDMF